MPSPVNFQHAENLAKHVQAGQLLLLDKGSYSDYDVVGFFVALESFCPMEQIEAFIRAHPEQIEEGAYFEHDTLVAFLIRSGLLLEVQYSTLYLGEYHDLESVNFLS